MRQVAESPAFFVEAAQSGSTPTMRRVLWQFSFLYAIVDRGTAFNKHSYLETILRGLSSHYNVKFEQIVSAICELRIHPAHSSSMPEEFWSLVGAWQNQRVNTDDIYDPGNGQEGAETEEQYLSRGYELYDCIADCLFKKHANADEIAQLLELARREFPHVWRRVLRESEPFLPTNRNANADGKFPCQFVDGVGWIVRCPLGTGDAGLDDWLPIEDAKALDSRLRLIRIRKGRTALAEAVAGVFQHLMSEEVKLNLVAFEALLRDDDVVESLMETLPEHDFLKLILASAPPGFERWIAIAEHMADAAGLRDRRLFWRFLWVASRGSATRISETAFAEAWCHVLAEELRVDVRVLHASLARRFTASSGTGRSAQFVRMAVLLDHCTPRSALRASNIKEMHAIAAPSTKSTTRTASKVSEGEPIFIANAGLAIVSHYLPRLFSMTGALEESEFRNEEARCRAVCLLQYLVDGSLTFTEHRLPLNKILCGMEPEAVVDCNVVPNSTETEAVDGLLQAVIAHWSAIGKTSVAGLRESFLQREGRLSRTAHGWQLLVQSRTFDMLLDRLPWSYKLTKHAWMPTALHVEWR